MNVLLALLYLYKYTCLFCTVNDVVFCILVVVCKTLYDVIFLIDCKHVVLICLQQVVETCTGITQ